MKGIIYGVGTGPGDPELMTLKAVRLIRECDIIAVPGKNVEDSFAFQIARKAVPEIVDKKLLAIDMPMLKDRVALHAEHQKGAKILEKYADRGENVVFLTIGDPMIYCTFSYLQHILEEDGYPVELVNGVTSFCAVAAKLKLPLAEWDEPLHIVPAVHKTKDALEREGNFVLMKSASQMKTVKELVRETGLDVQAVENCGTENEKVYSDLEDIPDDAGYFTLLIAKSKRSEQL